MKLHNKNNELTLIKKLVCNNSRTVFSQYCLKSYSSITLSKTVIAKDLDWKRKKDPRCINTL